MSRNPYNRVDPGNDVEIHLMRLLGTRGHVDMVMTLSKVPKNLKGKRIIVNAGDNAMVNSDFMEEFLVRLNLCEVESIWFRGASNEISEVIEKVLDESRYSTPEQKKVRDEIAGKINYVTDPLTDFAPRLGASEI